MRDEVKQEPVAADLARRLSSALGTLRQGAQAGEGLGWLALAPPQAVAATLLVLAESGAGAVAQSAPAVKKAPAPQAKAPKAAAQAQKPAAPTAGDSQVPEWRKLFPHLASRVDAGKKSGK